MADNVTASNGGSAQPQYVFATDDIGGVQYPRFKVTFGVDGVATDVSAGSPLPTTGLTDAQLRATAVPVSAPANGFPLRSDGFVVSSSNPLPVFINSGVLNLFGTYEDGLPFGGLGESGIYTLARRQDSNTSIAADGEFVGLTTDSQGRLKVSNAGIGTSNDLYIDGSDGQIILARRRDSDSSPATDGDLTVLNVDEEGRLKVSTKPATYPDITGDITAIQATIGTPVVGGTVAGDVSRASNVMAFCTGTFSTVNCTFEGSLQDTGDTNWFAIQAVRSNANTIETATGNLSAQPAYAWELSVNALRRLRVRCTARTSGTQSWRFVLGTYATEPIPAAQISGTQPVSGTVTANLTVPTSVADVASAAITTTTTTAAFTPSSGCAYTIFIPVTVVSGTNPTLDVMVQESDDAGTNWFDVYQFPRITATGAYRSPALKLIGNRVRYVQTITGTTPSFTRAIARLQRQCVVDKTAQLFDRTISLTTLNAATTSLNTMGISNAQLVINLGAATTPPQIQLEGSDDSANWYALGSPLTGVASSTVQLTVADVSPRFLRARVSVVGATVTAGYVLIKGF
jgi:hypothetical protein